VLLQPVASAVVAVGGCSAGVSSAGGCSPSGGGSLAFAPAKHWLLLLHAYPEGQLSGAWVQLWVQTRTPPAGFTQRFELHSGLMLQG
jgi:hypothetical protein